MVEYGVDGTAKTDGAETSALEFRQTEGTACKVLQKTNDPNANIDNTDHPESNDADAITEQRSIYAQSGSAGRTGQSHFEPIHAIELRVFERPSNRSWHTARAIHS